LRRFDENREFVKSFVNASGLKERIVLRRA
jgi:hypothetical protein